MTPPGELADELARGLDGPHADENTAGAARLCAEAVRFLNYATGSHSLQGLVFPSTVYAVAGDLSSAAGCLPQLFGQLTSWLWREDERGNLGTDDRTPAADTVAAAEIRLEAAARYAHLLARELAALQSAISGLNGRGPAREGGA